MKVILRPGHGLCPPTGPDIDYSYCRRGSDHWGLQRPGNREDDYTAEFCSLYLIPALVAAGHEVIPLRALDPVTGELDEERVTVGPETLPGLGEEQAGTFPRWRLSAAVEGALQGVSSCRGWVGYSWSFDPVAACQWEAAIPGDGCYLSIHQNWWSNSKMFGPSVYYYGDKRRFSRGGRALARMAYAAICSAFADLEDWADETRIPWEGGERLAYRIKTGSRWGCHRSRLWEVRATRRPAVLVELGFASNPVDAALMHDPAWCSQMAAAISRGLSA